MKPASEKMSKHDALFNAAAAPRLVPKRQFHVFFQAPLNPNIIS